MIPSTQFNHSYLSQAWRPCLRLVAGGCLSVLLAAWFTGCNKPTVGSPSDGKVLGSLYTNSFFNLTLNIPSGWSVGAVQPVVSPRSTPAPNGKTSTPAASSFQLLMVSEKPLNSGSDSNASLLVMAEKVSTVPGVKDARDYIARISQLMVDAPIAYHPTIPITEMSLGNARAQRLDFVAKLGPDKTARQSYIATLREGYVISFILSAGDDGGIRRAEQASRSVKFH